MPDILIRDLDEAVVARLKQRAEMNKRSLQKEAQAILETAARQPTREERTRLVREMQEAWGDRVFSDSTPLIREDRDR